MLCFPHHRRDYDVQLSQGRPVMAVMIALSLGRRTKDSIKETGLNFRVSSCTCGWLGSLGCHSKRTKGSGSAHACAGGGAHRDAAAGQELCKGVGEVVAVVVEQAVGCGGEDGLLLLQEVFSHILGQLCDPAGCLTVSCWLIELRYLSL